MTLRDKWKVIRQVKPGYLKATRSERSQRLDHLEETLGMHRKSIIRRIHSDLERKPRSCQRGRTYGAQVDDALRVISEAFDHICAQRITPNLVWMAEHLAGHGELETTPALLEKLGAVSVSTVGRILKRQPRDRPRLPQKGPKRANRLRHEIPAERIAWQQQQPGHFEVDLVHHCGPSASGHYVHTLQMIDVATGWSERVAVLGRSYLVMQDAFRRILARLPFPVVEIHPDNGSEFLNHHLIHFWKDRVEGVRLSRSRAWHKNDNRFVEQKNDTLVRAYLGCERLDTVEHTNLLNRLYGHMWLYYNLFQPVMRLSEKVVLPADGGRASRIKRRFDEARTPFDRLHTTGALSPHQHNQLLTLRDETNPRQLRQQIYGLLDQLFALPLAPPGSTQDVYQTLFAPPDFMKGGDVPVTLSNDRTITLR